MVSYTFHHAIVFVLTFVSYALLHASRKTFSNVKSTILATWTPEDLNETDIFDQSWNGHRLFDDHFAAERFMGILDAVFMSCYAAGLFVSGMLGDRLDPRLVLAFGMWGSGVTIFLFGTLLEMFQWYSRTVYVLLWMVNGFIQSAGWPAEVCIMANWFGRHGRGLIFGIWGACASLGNIVGAELCSYILPYGYENAFLVNATIVFCAGFVVFFGLVSCPSELGLESAVEDQPTSEAEEQLLPTSNEPDHHLKPITFYRALTLPGVLPYSLAYACLKFVNYSIFFWLPLYLTINFKWPERIADHVSTFYDWGGIAGGILGGLLSDFIGKRTPIICGQLILGTVALFVYSKSPNDIVVNGVLMGVAGFFCNGASNLISGAVSADLGRQKEVLGNAEALSTVTGIVDGTGSVGAAIGQLIIPPLEATAGWMSVFYLFIAMAAVTVCCLTKLCLSECKAIGRRARRPSFSASTSAQRA